jgi:hypothetical protein
MACHLWSMRLRTKLAILGASDATNAMQDMATNTPAAKTD